MVDVTQQDIMELKQKGFSDKDISDALKELESEEQSKLIESGYNQSKINQIDPRSSSQTSTFTTRPDDNLIRWQLDLSEILERAEHVLRGDRLQFRDGHTIWIKPDKEEDQILNNYGIQEVIRILSMYINRNTILSNYDEKTINTKVYDFGCELSDLFFMKYENFGWKDKLEKRKNYPMLMREMIDIVHSSYLRALGGKERESVHKSIQVSQSEALNQQNMQQQSQNKERSLLNPARYLVGRYK